MDVFRFTNLENIRTVKRAELCCRTNMSGPTSPIHVEELIKECDSLGINSIAITDYMSVQSFPQAYRTVQKYGSSVKIIYGMEIPVIDSKGLMFPIILLAKNKTGLKNLYTILSLINTEYCEKEITEDIVVQYRDGLLVGCTSECIQEILDLDNITDQKSKLLFFDYIQITPWDEERFNIRIVKLGKECDIPIVASCTPRVLNKEDEIAVKAWNYVKAESTEDEVPYMMTPEELLKALCYLSEEDALNTVVSNPKMLADKIEDISPICSDRLICRIDNAKNLLQKCCYKKANALYGKTLPKAVNERLSKEFSWIQKNDFYDIMYAAKLLVDKTRDDGYIVGSRGCLGASFVAFLAGISEVNPLMAHYYCPECGYFEVADSTNDETGLDLDDKICPECGKALKKDGYNIPAETFFGLEGDKEPDIDFNFAGEYLHRAADNLREIFGAENVFRAGTIGTVLEKIAYECIKEYFDAKGLKYSPSDIDKYARILCGSKKAQGLHPGGYIVLPRGEDINEYTPIWENEFSDGTYELVSHFEYHDIDSSFYKFDLLGHGMLGILHRLWELTGIDPLTIDITDKKIFELFKGIESIGLNPSDVCGFKYGTLGIRDFANRDVTDILEIYKPENINDLIRILGLAHSTNGWNDNAEDLIVTGTAKPSEVIAFRDDVYQYLIKKGLDADKAYKIEHAVRIGRIYSKRFAGWDSLRQEMSEIGIPEWYIKSCEKIMYLFPKAHSVAYTMLSLRLAYYKVYYPESFYKAVLEYELDDADNYLKLSGEELTEKINSISADDTLFYCECGITEEELLLIKEIHARNIRISN